MGGGDRQRSRACVVGGVELVRALGAAGVRSTVVTPAGDPAGQSRFAAARLEPSGRPIVEVLADHGARLPEPAVLFFDSDEVLLEVSRARERLASGFRFLLPPAD